MSTADYCTSGAVTLSNTFSRSSMYSSSSVDLYLYSNVVNASSFASSNSISGFYDSRSTNFALSYGTGKFSLTSASSYATGNDKLYPAVRWDFTLPQCVVSMLLFFLSFYYDYSNFPFSFFHK